MRSCAAAGAAGAFARAYEAAEQTGDYDRRASMGDQLFVRQHLVDARAGVPAGELESFDRRADLLIELAYHSGAAVAPAYTTRTDREIGDALAGAQEHSP